MSVIVDPFVSYLVERVGDSVINEVRFLCGVKKQVEEMQIELQWMQSFLEDADRLDVHAQSSVDRLRVSEIREASLDAEDVVDSYLIKLAMRKRGGKLNPIKRFVCIIKEKRDIHKVGSEIKAIKARLETLMRRLQTYGMSRDPKLGETSSSSRGQWQRRTYGHIVDRYIVGLDGKTEEVVGLLLREEKPCNVVSIYGMGGLGKTTLARKVYHDDKIRRSFDKFAWVCVSQQFKPRDVLEAIYIELISPSLNQRKEIRKLVDDEIVSKLYHVQKDHKCFLVLDDIWSIVAWNTLLAAFPMEESATGSKVLFTTRNMELAEHVDHRGSYGGLEPLSPDQSLELLQEIAFARRDDIEGKESKENLGKEMIKHCGGLPLAIVVLAGTLATKKSLREWEVVGNNIRAYLNRGKGDNKEQCLGVDGVLSFSYYDLPRQLKPCFLYLSQFPEDYEIRTNRLLKMWMAEGFVSIQNDGGEEEMIEDVAERYLNELVGRCMIQVGKEGSTGRVKTCRMHDLMREMCLSKAKKENFIQSFIGRIGTNTLGRVRRLSCVLDKDPAMFDYHENFRLRSLILYHDQYGWVKNVISAPMMTNFKLLRMLVLEGIDIIEEKFTEEIGNLIQLKHLSLRDSYVLYFPSMEKLGCLETLDLRVDDDEAYKCRGLLNVDAIWKMKNLRHLYLPSSEEHYSTRWSKDMQIMGMNMKSVQTLVNFPPPHCPLSEVVNFPNLRKLQIMFTLNNSKELGQIFGPGLSSLSVVFGDERWEAFEKIDLEGILMGCPNVYKLRLEGCLVNFPPEVGQLATKLTKLILEGSFIEDPKHIETNLGKLPNLKILHLGWKSFIGRELCFQLGSFPQLKSLRLRLLENLEDWRVDQGAMPILQSLQFSDCLHLYMVPRGLIFIATLKELRITRMPWDFKARVKEGGLDYYKVEHIPTMIMD